MISPSRRFELWLLAMMPGMVTAMLAIFFLVAKHIGGLSHFMPVLPLIPVFYWGLTLARDMPYWFVFLLGLVMDAVTGQPFLSPLLYLLFLGLLHAQRKYIHKEGFIVKWGYFALLLGVISILNWIVLSFFYSAAMSFTPAFLQWLLTVCCYPALHKAFDGIYEHIHSRRWQILHGR